MHLFAVVSWLKEHPARRGYCSKLFELWWKDLFDSNLVEYLPVQLIIFHAVYCDIKYEEQTVFLICPVQNIPALDYITIFVLVKRIVRILYMRKFEVNLVLHLDIIKIEINFKLKVKMNKILIYGFQWG